jgi:hypothetical protein
MGGKMSKLEEDILNKLRYPDKFLVKIIVGLAEEINALQTQVKELQDNKAWKIKTNYTSSKQIDHSNLEEILEKLEKNCKDIGKVE